MNEWDPPDSDPSRAFWQRASELLVVFSADGIIVECDPARGRHSDGAATGTLPRRLTVQQRPAVVAQGQLVVASRMTAATCEGSSNIGT